MPNPFQNSSQIVDSIELTLSEIKGHALSALEREKIAILIASQLLQAAQQGESSSERSRRLKLARLMDDPRGKAWTCTITDQCFRSSLPKRIADQFVFLIKKFGIPHYLSRMEKAKLKVFKAVCKLIPSLFVPLVNQMVRQEMAGVILPGNKKKLLCHLRKRKKEKITVNLNHLGEAILGEEEAERRLKLYLDDLAQPEIEVISVKISTLFSQINLLDWVGTVQSLAEKLRELYRAAIKNRTEKGAAKFVNLDMEEYKDLALTVSLFRKILDEPEFFTFSAGIALQSYLPDSFLIQKELTHWALSRVKRGGAPIKIRLVKGANLGLEQIESALRGWPQAPYCSKVEADANFKRMLFYGCLKEHAKAVFIGIGSHNLFDIAYGLTLRAEEDVEENASFEMLEGMADPLMKAVQKVAKGMLLYSPAAKREQFHNAVAYLIRRMDENSGAENFLRDFFNLHQGSAGWERQTQFFNDSCHKIDSTYLGSRRNQNRFLTPSKLPLLSPFENDPDTDWSLPQNRLFAHTILRKWQRKALASLPLVIGGKELYSHEPASGRDPSTSKILYHYSLATIEEAELALQTSFQAQMEWQNTPFTERRETLRQAALLFRIHRGELLGAMLANCGKTFLESDGEVSEAIDFIEYYCRSAEELLNYTGAQLNGKGSVLVAPPWNFPCSIPVGGIAASLICGNSVIFKPAPEAVLVGWQLASLFWQAGIPKNVLQWVTCSDEPVGSYLVNDPRIALINLTGSTSTAKLFLKMRPGVDLIAETGGKNSMIITDMADRDLAVKDLLQSAFGYSGQKCSAASLAICEAAIYDDPHFLAQLRDGAKSLPVGPAWSMKSKITPLIKEPTGALLRGLLELETGEEWLLKPIQDVRNPFLWSPGIKLGVRPGNFTHQNELFGPVLGLMRAENFQEAIKFANATPYGLTAGLHSLDEREHDLWISQIEAGNCYINRTMTGAIVNRQPFGGCKESSYGSGLKSGGPNYLIQFCKFLEISLPKERIGLSLHLGKQLEDAKALLPDSEHHILEASLHSYLFWWQQFKEKKDQNLLLGQDNFFYLIARKGLALRTQPELASLDLIRIALATCICETPLLISWSKEHFSSELQHLLQCYPNVSLIEEDELNFAKQLSKRGTTRVRLCKPPSEELLHAAAEIGCHLLFSPVTSHGRFELLNYCREVALSIDYHRYGNLGMREQETRKPLPKAYQDL